MNLNKRININNFTTKYLLIICLIYYPFIFFSFINETFRLSSFTLLIVSLFIIFLPIKIKYDQLLRNCILLILFLIYTLSSIYVNYNNEGLRSSIGYSLILLLSLLVYFNVEGNLVFYNFLIKNYLKLFSFISFSIIINFVLNIFFPSINILTPYFPSSFNYNYNASFLSLSISKPILGIVFSRNFWFFIEPVYTAPFFLINIFIISPNVLIKNKYFLLLNTISGLLTFSYLFYIGYSILYLLKNKPRGLFLLIAISLMVVINLNFDYENSALISSSSSSDRILRINLAFEALYNLSNIKLFFGSGYLFSQSLGMGVSAGILSSFLEGGFVGMVIPLVMALIYTKFNKMIFCIVLLSLFTIEPYKMPFFWLTIIISGKLLTTNKYVK